MAGLRIGIWPCNKWKPTTRLLTRPQVLTLHYFWENKWRNTQGAYTLPLLMAADELSIHPDELVSDITALQEHNLIVYDFEYEAVVLRGYISESDKYSEREGKGIAPDTVTGWTRAIPELEESLPPKLFQAFIEEVCKAPLLIDALIAVGFDLAQYGVGT